MATCTVEAQCSGWPQYDGTPVPHHVVCPHTESAVSTEPVHPDLVKIALDKAEGFQFKRFVHSFYSTLVGASFVPLGGMRDGGADGFDGDAVYEEVGTPTAFYQASVQEDYRAKIRQTGRRLREVGRDPRTLVYVTSRTVSLPDAEERSLSRELS